jgi:bifunctional non-homologous end joining protein LigD
VEELRDARDPAAEIREELERSPVRRAPFDPDGIRLMLAEATRRPFSDRGWIFEIKFDGYRALGLRDAQGRPSLRSRNGEEMSATFPEISRALAALPYTGLAVDGELVVVNGEGRPDFHLLQGRAALRRRPDAQRAARETAAIFQVFDLLAIEGFDLRDRPLLERKEWLRRILPPAGPIRYTDHIEERGEEMFAAAREMELEGIMAKKADSPYRAGRSPLWQKLVADRTRDFAIIGFTGMQGGGDGLGALQLAAAEPGGGFRYVGRVGTGFSDSDRTELRRRLEPWRRADPVCAVPESEWSEGEGATGLSAKARAAMRANAARSRATRWRTTQAPTVWVDPKLTAEVRFRALTHAGVLRAAVFVRLREDKRPEDCEAPRPRPASDRASRPASDRAPRPAPDPVRKRSPVAFRHLNKVFWPEDGLTKGDLIEYYRTVAEAMLPYLEDRPLVLTRYPDGIHGPSFYQKDAPEHALDSLRTTRIYSSHTEREIAYFLCDDVDGLLYLANLATIPIHVWSSRASTIQNPDWCILDLDPKGAPFAHVIRLAHAIRDLCQAIGLPPFVKTTGSSGLHILLPLPPGCTYEQSRLLAQLLCGIVESRHPDVATTTRNIQARKGRVYLDALQNRHGQLLVSPYSVRPLPTAPVSAPLDWSEVNDGLQPRAFTIRNMPERLARQESDPMRELFRARVDLGGALRRLEALVAGA